MHGTSMSFPSKRVLKEFLGSGLLFRPGKTLIIWPLECKVEIKSFAVLYFINLKFCLPMKTLKTKGLHNLF